MKVTPIYVSIAVIVMFFLSACSGEVNGVPEPPPESRSSVEAGRHLILSYGCGTCHSIPGIPGADGTVGPSLDHFYEQMTIAGQLPNTQENLIKWIQNPQKVIPGDAMPNMGVTADQAKYIAAYLYHQPTFGELLVH